MTSDNTAGTDSTEPSGSPAATAGESAPRKPARRRATRAAAAPTGEAPLAPVVEPAPVEPVAAATTEPSAPQTPVAEPVAEPVVAPVTEPVAAPVTAPEGTAPKKRSRRATRPTAAAAAAAAGAAAAPASSTPEGPAEPANPVETATPVEAAADDAIVLPERASAEARQAAHDAAAEVAAGIRSLDDIVLPEGPTAPRAEPEAEAPEKPRKATRTRRKKADPAAVAAEPVPAPDAPATEASPEDAAEAAPTEVEQKPKRAARGRGRSAKATEKATEKSTGTPADAPTAPAATTAPEVAAAAPRTPESFPAATGGGSSTPRLATTALLFQAPDLSTPRRSRRAQAPAGPPRPHDETAAAPAAGEQPEAQPAAEPAPATGTRGGRSGSRARKGVAGRAAGAASKADEPTFVEPKAAEPKTAEPKAAEPVPVQLSRDEVAAAEEVGVIESELLAEGIELVVFGPEDLEYDESYEAVGDAGDAGDAGDGTVGEADEAGEDGEEVDDRPRRRRRRGGRGRRGGRRGDGAEDADDEAHDDTDEEDEPDESDAPEGEHAEDEGEDDDESSSSRRRRRRRRGTRGERAQAAAARTRDRSGADEVTALKGSTRLEAKRQRRREGRDAGRRRQIITEAEFLARREAVSRSMVVRESGGRTQIAVLEDGVLVEHYVSQQSQTSMVGNVYLGRVQNVLPSMEAAFVDVGKGRNAVLYAGEVNWDAAGLEGQPRRIEEALKSGDSVLVQVTKDPIGHKGARLTSQVTLAGRYLVLVPGGGMTGISRKLPDTERNRLKKILRDVVPDGAGVIVRTAAEGASEAELRADVERLQAQWAAIKAKSEKSTTSAPALLQGEPDLAIRVVRDIFNDDFSSLVVQGDGAWSEISHYVEELAPDLRERVSKWLENTDVFAVHRVDEQLAKGMDRKVWLPSGGSLVIDRTEAMTVIDVNTGKFTGAGGTLEETVTRNNLEAAEEIVRQLRLRDIGGIIVIDFIDMVLESNRDLVLRRLVECLGRDRTKHQVAEVTSLGLVQMTRKRVGQGLVEAFSETCEHCHGRGFIVHTDPVGRNGRPETTAPQPAAEQGESKRSRRKRAAADAGAAPAPAVPVLPEAREAVKATLATIAAAAAHAHDHDADRPEGSTPDVAPDVSPGAVTPTDAEQVPVAAADTGHGAATLDVMAELGAVVREPRRRRATRAATTDAQLELHAVAPEVFAVDDEADGTGPDVQDAPADGGAGPTTAPQQSDD